MRYGPSAGTAGTVYHSCRWPASRRTAPRPHGSAVSAAQASWPPSPAAHASVRSEVFECLMCSTVAHGSGLIGEASFFRTRIHPDSGSGPPAGLSDTKQGAVCSRRMLLEARVGAFPAVGACGGSEKRRRLPERVRHVASLSARCPLPLLATLGRGRWAWPPPPLSESPARGRAQRKAHRQSGVLQDPGFKTLGPGSCRRLPAFLTSGGGPNRNTRRCGAGGRMPDRGGF